MKKFYRKKYIDNILSKISNEKLFLLVGARQVGKTTIMEILKEKLEKDNKCLYFNFEDFFGLDFKSKNEFINYFKFEYGFDFYKPGIIFLDEIQYLSNPESVLKSLYDDKEIQIKIIATGSRFWGQKKVGSSLIGRGEIVKIYPFDFFEFLEVKGKDVSIFNDLSKYSESDYYLIEKLFDEYKQFGGYPAVIMKETKIDKINELKKIIDRFFEKDFTYFMKTSDLFDFKKVFQAIALNIGNTVKIDFLAQNLNISRYKINQFLDFLFDSYLIYPCYPYYKNKSKEYNKNYEIFFNDLGFLNYISGNSEIGKTSENFIYLEILKSQKTENIYFYKKNTGSEIDFIAENVDSKITAIEVKSANKDIISKVFYSFYEDYNEKINNFIITTDKLFKERELNNKKVLFIPNFLISKIL